MPLSLAYWTLMLFYVLGAVYWSWRTPADGRWPIGGWSLVLFLLLLVLGLHDFGAPLRGG